MGALPYVRGITFGGEVIDLGSPLEVVPSHPHPKRLAWIANAAAHGLRGVGGACDIRSAHTPGIPEVLTRSATASAALWSHA